MQGYFVLVRRETSRLYLVVCDGKAEAIAFVRAALELDSDVGAEVVGGLSDEEVAKQDLSPLTLIPL